MTDDKVVLEAFLKDQADDDCQRRLKVQIEVSKHFISISAEGYSEYDAVEATGTPILVEYYDGKLRVVCFDNINSQDPVIVDLEGALKSNRIPLDE